jgi:hypothetical protein
MANQQEAAPGGTPGGAHGAGEGVGGDGEPFRVGSPPPGPPPIPSAALPPGSPGRPGAASISPSATVAQGPITGLARLAAVILLLFGVWFAILGALTILAALDPSGFMGRQIGDAFGAVARGTVVFVGIGVLLVAIVEIAAAIGIWRGAGWGRVLGSVYAIVFALGSAGVLVLTHGPSTGSMALAVGILIAYIFVALVLAVRWRNRSRVEPTRGDG